MKIRLLGLALAVAALAPTSAGAQTSTTATGVSNALNPAISMNGLFEGTWRDPRSDEDGLTIREVEMAMTSIVDPFFKANVYVGYEPEREGPGAAVALEEAYATVLASLPSGTGLRVGRMLMPFGRQNQLHTHAFPFIEAPLASRGTLGPESAGDVAVEGTYNPDLPWYMNLRTWLGDGAVEDVFDGANRDLAEGARLENLWDLSEATSLEGAASFWGGPGLSGERRRFYGADLRVKYRDPRKTYGRAAEASAELIVDTGDGRPDRVGLTTLARTRVARRWWVGACYSFLSSIPEGAAERVRGNEVRGQVAFAPSEFSALRVELVYLDPGNADHEVSLHAQMNVTIGPHPAHAY
jgi:hypothetical protein